MIIVKLMGGLGNQMFQYAFARNLAIKTKSRLKIDIRFLKNRSAHIDHTLRDYDLDIFNICGGFTTQEEVESFELAGPIIKKLQKVLELRAQEKYYITDRNIFLFGDVSNLKGDIYLDGYWQSEKYFKDIEDIIREDFTFRMPLDKAAEGIAAEILSTNAVSMNIRRGDYLKHRNFLFECPAEYFLNAMDTISQSITNPTFYIFSDEIDWCRANLPFSKYTIKFVGREFTGVKFQSYLRLMILCKHHIISNSTFAWWGAWLNPSRQKIIVSPRNWIRHPLYFRHNQNINPADWIKL